jgi:hypothetical protein
MRTFLNQEIEKKNKYLFDQANPDLEPDPDTILEYSALIQELDDLSAEGTNAHTLRPMPVDIPLNNIDLETIEINLTDGRITDIPQDAAVQEAAFEEMLQETAVMKTKADFYTEACSALQRMSDRETDEMLESRRLQYATKEFESYSAGVIHETAQIISLGDDRVPVSMQMSFCESVSRVPVAFSSIGGKIHRRQLDALTLLNSVFYQECVMDYVQESVQKSEKKPIAAIRKTLAKGLKSGAYKNAYNFTPVSWWNTPVNIAGTTRAWQVICVGHIAVEDRKKAITYYTEQFGEALGKYKLRFVPIISTIDNFGAGLEHEKPYALVIDDDIPADAKITDKEIPAKVKAELKKESYDVTELMQVKQLIVPVQQAGSFTVQMVVESDYSAEDIKLEWRGTPIVIQEAATDPGDPEKKKKTKVKQECGGIEECAEGISKKKHIAEQALYESKRAARPMDMPSRFQTESYFDQSDEIKDEVIQEFFGPPKVHVSAAPATVKVNTGGDKSKNFSGKVYYEYGGSFWDNSFNIKILQKQKDQVTLFNEQEEGQKSLCDYIAQKLQGQIGGHLKKGETIWDIAEIVRGFSDIQPKDRYCITLEVNSNFLDEPQYYTRTWGSTKSPNAKDDGASAISSAGGKADMKSDSKDRKLGTKSDMGSIKQESGDMYQEAIDFGTPDDGGQSDTPPGTEGAPQVQGNVDTGTENSPPAGTEPVDAAAGGEAPVEGAPVEGEDATGAEPEIAGSNDISADIAQGVDAAMNENPADGELDGGDEFNTNLDVEGEEGAGDGTDLDVEGGFDDSPMDIESMSIDELIAQGSEKLKSMPLDELKSFLSDSTVEDIAQESFIVTRKNIGNAISKELTTALSILNDSEMDMEQIFTAFKKQSKKLNRVLSKGSKMKKAFSDEDRGHIEKLNRTLIDLTGALKDSKGSGAAVIKKMIQAFTSQAKVVEKLLTKEVPVTESFMDAWTQKRTKKGVS